MILILHKDLIRVMIFFSCGFLVNYFMHTKAASNVRSDIFISHIICD